jgi:hypothetical protein
MPSLNTSGVTHLTSTLPNARRFSRALVDYTGRLFREGKARISAEVAGILDRIGSGTDDWQVRMEKLKNGRSFGRFFASSRGKLREIANRLKVRHLANFVGCAVPS